MVKIRSIYKLSIAVLTTILLVGCSGKEEAKPAPMKTAVGQTKPKPVAAKPQEPSGMKLADLKAAGVITSLGLEGHSEYRENQPIEFSIDTGNAEGYLYIVHLDNAGKTGLLYPNPKSPEAEMGGAYMFPRDFGGMNIIATKDCVGCKEDKTTVYVLLSKEPIVDIEKITKDELLSFAPSTQSKGLKMDLNENNAPNKNLNVGVLEFVVK